MCYYSFTLTVYLIAINIFGIFVRYVYFQDYFECFACKEMAYSGQNYDYIVVGSGSAGSIIARRLIADKNTKVLLIEAGGFGSSLFEIPTVAPMLQNTAFDWQYRTVPQKKACLGLDKKVSRWPMGKIVGGTSMLNNMMYTRGHPEDFAQWYQHDPNFDYTTDILPYFRKVENYGFDDERSSAIINDAVFRSNLSRRIMQAAKCARFPINNGTDSVPGFSYPKTTMHKGRRWTSWHQLSKHKKRRNLVIMTNSEVEKVIFKGKYEAYAVKYRHLDQNYYVRASKGVILAAGVIGTPKILMLSGVGHIKHLKKVKIKPVVDLPVGDALQDHVTTGLDLISIDTSIDIGISDILWPFSAIQYFIQSKGPWTCTGCENLAFFSSEAQRAPDLQFMVLPVGITADNGTFLRSLTGIGGKLWESYFSNITKRSFTILPIVLHPKSRGTVRLKNKNPKSPPLIDPNYLAEDYDVDVIVRGIEEIKMFLQSTPMRNVGAKLNTNKFPGCEKFEFDTKPYWECYVRHLTITSYHPVGTCSLDLVVNYEFQVKGTNRLYVADGSILPGLPSGNPIAAIMMMAEKAADAIKYQRWLTENKCQAKEVFIKKLVC